MFGKILKRLRRRSTMSCPTICGSSSSGYITRMLWLGHRGVVFITIGWACPSISSCSSSFSKKFSVIL